MVISSGIFRCNELDGYVAVDESGEIIGCITYVIDGKDCEIISLDSIIEKKGFGCFTAAGSGSKVIIIPQVS